MRNIDRRERPLEIRKSMDDIAAVDVIANDLAGVVDSMGIGSGGIGIIERVIAVAALPEGQAGREAENR